MDDKLNINQHNHAVIAELDSLIEIHERILKDLNLSRQIWLNFTPPELTIVNSSLPLSRELVRKVVKAAAQPLQTVQIIDILYPDKNVEEKYYLTRHLAVILSQMAKRNELIAEKRQGLKGNFYRLNNDTP